MRELQVSRLFKEKSLDHQHQALIVGLLQNYDSDDLIPCRWAAAHERFSSDIGTLHMTMTSNKTDLSKLIRAGCFTDQA